MTCECEASDTPYRGVRAAPTAVAMVHGSVAKKPSIPAYSSSWRIAFGRGSL
jgi:hypothetical protein